MKTKLPTNITLREAVDTLWGQEIREVSLQITGTLSNIQFAAEKLFSAGKKIISFERFINEINRYWIDPDYQISGFEIVEFNRLEFNLNSDTYYGFHPNFVKFQFKWVKIPPGILRKHHRKPWCLGGDEDRKNVRTVSRKKHFAFHVMFNTNAGAMNGEEVVRYAGLIYQCVRTVFFDEQGNLLAIPDVLEKILSIWPSLPHINASFFEVERKESGG